MPARYEQETRVYQSGTYAEQVEQRYKLLTEVYGFTAQLRGPVMFYSSLLLTMNMGATLFRMNVVECLAGVTREAARALGILGEAGTLEEGKNCDLAIWDIERPAELVYRIGFNPLHLRVWRGQ